MPNERRVITCGAFSSTTRWQGQLAAPTATSLFRVIQSDANHAAIELLTIQCRDGSSALVSFHFDSGKTFALTGKDIFHELDRAHCTIFGEECTNALFGGNTRQTAYKDCNQWDLTNVGCETTDTISLPPSNNAASIRVPK